MKNAATTLGIRDIPEFDRPRERLEMLGESALTKGELLAILLRVGVEGENAVQLGWKLIRTFGDLRGLHRASFEELCAVKGVGRAKAAQIKAAIELGYRMSREEVETGGQISKPEDVYDLMGHTLSVKSQEELWVLALNTRNRIIRKELLYVGTLNHSSVRLAEIFALPMRVSANAIILVHNHPSGEANPSEEDIRFTEELVRAGKLLDIGVLDHIIIGAKGSCSIRGLGKVAFHSPKPQYWH